MRDDCAEDHDSAEDDQHFSISLGFGVSRSAGAQSIICAKHLDKDRSKLSCSCGKPMACPAITCWEELSRKDVSR